MKKYKCLNALILIIDSLNLKKIFVKYVKELMLWKNAILSFFNIIRQKLLRIIYPNPFLKENQ